MIRSTHFQKSYPLLKEDLRDHASACPVCGSGRERRQLFAIQEEPAVYLLKCLDCHGASASQMPTRSALDRYYTNYYPEGNEKYTFSEPGRIIRHILSNLNLTGPKIRLLDFGGGDGTIGMGIAEALAEEGREVEMVLVDYEEPPAYQDDRISYRHYHDLDRVEGKFDLIIASAILEHIPALKPVMENLFRLASVGCYFYARTPWVAPLARIFPRLDFTFPGHVHDLGAPFWNRVPETFKIPASLVKSQPSIIETTLRSNAIRTATAYLLKFPAHLERKICPWRKDQLLQLTGGWEAFIKFNDPS